MTCPRCGLPCVQRFYGPCGACRIELRRKAVAYMEMVAKLDQLGGYKSDQRIAFGSYRG